MVMVYKVKRYDWQSDEIIVSKRLATIEGARLMGGDIIGSSGVEIPESDLESGQQWTARGYIARNPSAVGRMR
jgi:hypothetical protein